jgi:T-complex protein 1 subunit gamma
MQAPVMVLSKASRQLLHVFQTRAHHICTHLTDANTKRETGKTAQLGNIQAAKVTGWLFPALHLITSNHQLLHFLQAVADIIRTTLGPRSMLKMLLDPMGGIVMTNDGNCILREVDVSHPAAKSMIELSRAQDEEVGDGTTSVIILSKFPTK